MGPPLWISVRSEKHHAQLTDGSAKHIGQERHWKAVAYDPHSKVTLETEGRDGSSQLAELQAVHQALKQEQGGQCHICTDSWAVANGLATWMPTWKNNNWEIHRREIWGMPVREEIWEIVQKTNVSVFHVDAHTKKDTLECQHNRPADQLANIATASQDDHRKLHWQNGSITKLDT
ncbi:ribonuclease H [Rhinolophus sinicus]|uniref:ribonuclease H n=1 Tax=Rhinolophus sinicus TaxID=89399 RepID=UPI003D7BDF8D